MVSVKMVIVVMGGSIEAAEQIAQAAEQEAKRMIAGRRPQIVVLS